MLRVERLSSDEPGLSATRVHAFEPSGTSVILPALRATVLFQSEPQALAFDANGSPLVSTDNEITALLPDNGGHELPSSIDANDDPDRGRDLATSRVSIPPGAPAAFFLPSLCLDPMSQQATIGPPIAWPRNGAPRDRPIQACRPSSST